MEYIGKLGFGRDVSTGLGRFKVKDLSGFWYALSPFVPSSNFAGKIWFQPFVMFGRHGNYLALSEKPFKNPVIMADEGAVIKKPDNWDRTYCGIALTGLSKIQPEAVGQVYTIVIPCNLGFNQGS